MVAYEEQTDESQVATEITNRMRVLESKQSQFNERLLLVNQNMIDSHKDSQANIKNLRSDIDELKKDLQNVKRVMKHLSEEAANFARKDNLLVLEKYINLWNPLNFVTKKELEETTRKKEPEPMQKEEGAKIAKRINPNK